MGGISIWQLLIIAVIVVLLFGTNKLRTLGSDLGSSIKGFKKPWAMKTRKIKTMLMMLTSMPNWRKKDQTEAKKEDVKNDKV